MTNSGWSTCDLYYTKCTEGKRAVPEQAEFQGGHDGWLPFFTPGGNRFFFSSGRPDKKSVNIYSCTRTKNGWSKPEMLSANVNSPFYEWRAVLSESGALYFASNRSGGAGESDIYRSEMKNGEFSPAELVPGINSAYTDASPFIAPDEKYFLLESWRPGGSGQADLYICYKKDDGSWTGPQNLGAEINTS